MIGIKKIGLVSAIFAILISSGFAKPSVQIKFATLAPEGSTWMNVMRELDSELQTATNGEVGFKLYPGGVQGDEPDVLRKMRFGQIHSAGFTGNGLGEILPDVRVLELPFFFNSKEEVDLITTNLYDEFDNAFREKGFVLLGWTEVGYVYFFGNSPIQDISDLDGIRIWSWEGDPLARIMFEELNVTPIPLALTEVLTGLQTGMLDAVYTTPLAAMSLQWFTRVKYINQFPITNATGAILMTTKQFEKIPEQYRDDVISISRGKLRELTLKSRLDNTKSIEELQKSGLTIAPAPSAAQLEVFNRVGVSVKNRMRNKLISDEVMQMVESELDAYRKTKN